MSSVTVYDAIKARLVDTLGGTYPIRDWEEIETQLQQATAPWIAVEDSGGSSDLNSIGTPSENWTTDEGFIEIHIFTPSTESLSPTRTIADQVRDVLFYYQFTVPIGTLRSLTVDPPATGLVQHGLWNSMTVTVNYSHQYAKATAA